MEEKCQGTNLRKVEPNPKVSQEMERCQGTNLRKMEQNPKVFLEMEGKCQQKVEPKPKV